jgi:hypothetical protein
MGLDMYLTAERFFGGYTDEAGRDKVLAACSDNIPPMSRASGSAVVSFEVAYWRKANAIHGWFVENVQDGKDDCNRYYVPLGALHDLLALCEGVLSEAIDPDELEPTSGFFFGPTDDEDWYRQCLELTVEQLKPLLEWFEADNSRKNWDVYYQASW